MALIPSTRLWRRWRPTTNFTDAAWRRRWRSSSSWRRVQPITSWTSAAGSVGPRFARYFASRFDCRVTGIDLTPEFCDVARHLTRLLNLEERVKFELGDALAMPFA